MDENAFCWVVFWWRHRTKARKHRTKIIQNHLRPKKQTEPKNQTFDPPQRKGDPLSQTSLRVFFWASFGKCEAEPRQLRCPGPHATLSEAAKALGRAASRANPEVWLLRKPCEGGDRGGPLGEIGKSRKSIAIEGWGGQS